jgi:hypothetical protein
MSCNLHHHERAYDARLRAFYLLDRRSESRGCSASARSSCEGLADDEEAQALHAARALQVSELPTRTLSTAGWLISGPSVVDGSSPPPCLNSPTFLVTASVNAS